MRFLVDENLSPRVSSLLTASGHDAVHVRDLGLPGGSDAEVMDQAVASDRVIVSADTDFGALLAHTRADKPSVILVRALFCTSISRPALSSLSPRPTSASGHCPSSDHTSQPNATAANGWRLLARETCVNAGRRPVR